MTKSVGSLSGQSVFERGSDIRILGRKQHKEYRQVMNDLLEHEPFVEKLEELGIDPKTVTYMDVVYIDDEEFQINVSADRPDRQGQEIHSIDVSPDDAIIYDAAAYLLGMGDAPEFSTPPKDPKSSPRKSKSKETPPAAPPPNPYPWGYPNPYGPIPPHNGPAPQPNAAPAPQQDDERIGELEREIGRLQRRLRARTLELQPLEAEVQRLRGLDGDNLNLINDIRRLQGQVRHAHQDLHDARQELDALRPLRGANGQLRGRADAADDEIQRLQQRLAQALQQLAAAQAHPQPAAQHPPAAAIPQPAPAAQVDLQPLQLQIQQLGQQIAGIQQLLAAQQPPAAAPPVPMPAPPAVGQGAAAAIPLPAAAAPLDLNQLQQQLQHHFGQQIAALQQHLDEQIAAIPQPAAVAPVDVNQLQQQLQQHFAQQIAALQQQLANQIAAIPQPAPAAPIDLNQLQQQLQHHFGQQIAALQQQLGQQIAAIHLPAPAHQVPPPAPPVIGQGAAAPLDNGLQAQIDALRIQNQQFLQRAVNAEADLGLARHQTQVDIAALQQLRQQLAAARRANAQAAEHPPEANQAPINLIPFQRRIADLEQLIDQRNQQLFLSQAVHAALFAEIAQRNQIIGQGVQALQYMRARIEQLQRQLVIEQRELADAQGDVQLLQEELNERDERIENIGELNGDLQNQVERQQQMLARVHPVPRLAADNFFHERQLAPVLRRGANPPLANLWAGMQRGRGSPFFLGGFRRGQ